MSRPRICLLVAYYPPSAESGARRPYNLVRALRGAGFPVDVLVAGPGETSAVVGDHGETIYHAVTNPPRPPSRWQRLFDRVRIRLIRVFLSEFDPAVRYRRSIRRAIHRYLAEHEALVYLSAPPAGLAALAIPGNGVFRPDQKVVLEFRDPWSTDITGPRLTRLKPRYERRRIAAVRSACAIVTVTEGIAERMRESGLRRDPVIAINGIPDEFLDRPSAPPRAPGRELTMLYLGEFYLSRDPAPILDALASLRRSDPTLATRIRLQLVGEVEDTPRGPLRALLDRHGLAEVTTISPRVAYARARELLRDADLFLLLAQDQPRQVPNKLYEYLAYRRPILTIADQEGETARLLRQTGHADTLVRTGASPVEVESALERALRAARHDVPVGDTGAIASLASSRQFSKIVDLLNQLGRSTTHPETVDRA